MIRGSLKGNLLVERDFDEPREAEMKEHYSHGHKEAKKEVAIGRERLERSSSVQGT